MDHTQIQRTTTVDHYVVVVTLLGERNPRRIRHPRLVVSSLGCPPGQISLRLASKARAFPLAPRAVGTALPRFVHTSQPSYRQRYCYWQDGHVSLISHS